MRFHIPNNLCAKCNCSIYSIEKKKKTEEKINFNEKMILAVLMASLESGKKYLWNVKREMKSYGFFFVAILK